MTTTPTAAQVKVGDFLQETLVTDTLTYVVTRVTPHTITVERTTDTGETISENRYGNPFPVVYAVQAAPASTELRFSKVARRRKDGTYRMGPGANPLRPCITRDGKPVRVTDYRY